MFLGELVCDGGGVCHREPLVSGALGVLQVLMKSVFCWELVTKWLSEAVTTGQTSECGHCGKEWTHGAQRPLSDDLDAL